MGDADITLRHITRRHAEALVRPYLGGDPAEILGWADTQVTATERRLDKTLLLRLAGEVLVSAIRASTSAGDERWELFAAMLVMADVDPWGHNLRMRIEAMIRDEPTDMLQVSKTLRDAYELGQREGIEKGIEKMLHGLFARRLHRPLTPREQETLAARATIDPDQIQEKALSLEGEALAAWLLAPAASVKRQSRPRRR